LSFFKIAYNGLAMVRGAFCGALSCPAKDRKHHENPKISLPVFAP